MSTIKTTVEAKQPGLEFEGTWGAKIDDDAAYEYYKTAIFDLTSLLYAKVGVEFSKYGLDGDVSRLNGELDDIKASLRAGNVIG